MDLIYIKKGGNLSCGTRADATWHARPRGTTMPTQVSACVVWRGRGRVAGPRESMRTHGWRHVAWGLHGWQMMGPRVSGPRWVVWGGNAKLTFWLTFYTRVFWKFLSCGTMFPLHLFFVGHVAEHCALDRELTEDRPLIRWISVHRLTLQHVASRGGDNIQS